MIKTKKNQDGSILVSALIVTLLFTISSLYILKQAEQLDKQSQLPRFLNAFKNMENRLNSKINSIRWSTCAPAVVSGSSADDIRACLVANNINEVNWNAPVYGRFEVDLTNLSIDADNFLNVTIGYNPGTSNSTQSALKNFRERKQVKISTDLTNTTSSSLCTAGQVIKGFNSDGSIICQWIQGSGITSFSCPEAMYMKGILGDGRPDCVNLNQVIACPAGQIITQLIWRGGVPVYSCSPKANPATLFGSWRPIMGL